MSRQLHLFQFQDNPNIFLSIQVLNTLEELTFIEMGLLTSSGVGKESDKAAQILNSFISM